MKKSILIIATLLLSSWALAQSCPVPEPLEKKEALGTWDGAYSTEGKFMDMTLKISEKNGKLSASMDIPEFKAKNVTYEIKICDSEELHIKKIDATSSIEFIGRPENNIINGQVKFTSNGEVVSTEVFTARRISTVASK